MAAITSQIRWGTGSENILRVRVLADLLADRPAREGSEWLKTPAGGADSWVVGRDYRLSCRIRWVPMGGDGSSYTPWSGPTGVQAFLDWARDSNSFRFVPDSTYPSAYADGCYLTEPWAGGMSLADILKDDGYRARQHLDLTIQHPTIDLHLLYRGLLFEYVPGASLTDPVAYTVTRASIARYHGASGVGAEATANTLRDRHYIAGVRGTLLEGGRVNLVSAPENFGGWTDTASAPVKTSGQADPFGGTAAYLLNDDHGTNAEGVTLVVAFTGDATKGFAIYMKAGTAGHTEFGIYDNTAGAWRHKVRATWASGVPTLSTQDGAGVLFPVEAMMSSAGVATGWYRLKANATGVVAANTNRFEIYPAGGTGANTGTVYVFGAQAQDFLYPTSYTGPSTLTHAADLCTVAIPWGTQDITVYAKLPRPDWADASGSLAHHCGLVGIGNDTVDQGAIIYGSLTARNWEAWIGGNVASTAIPAGATQEVCAQFRFATDGKCRLDVGSGFGSLSSAAADTTFQNSTLRLGSYSVGSELDGAISVLRVAYGLRTLAEMQAL